MIDKAPETPGLCAWCSTVPPLDSRIVCCKCSSQPAIDLDALREAS